MAGALSPIYGCQESLPIREPCISYRACPPRAHRGQNDRRVEGARVGSVQKTIGKLVAARQAADASYSYFSLDKIVVLG